MKFSIYLPLPSFINRFVIYNISDDDGDGEVLTYGLNKTISSNKTYRLQVGQSNLTVAVDLSSTISITTKASTMSRDIGLVSSFTTQSDKSLKKRVKTR
ncbi:unnamed protein product [Rotaria magnacalcarata]|uniref:Uncharacterized protein n=1 Tax=Rotaria magnacalcarata TaxID=392030 RepID=A0A816YRP2_9BILA|nr:unnamed protein product [Rotaria magnacalcarata]